MKKYIKWVLVGIAVATIAIVMGIRAFVPQVNDELNDAPVQKTAKKSNVLNVKAVIVKETNLTDDFFVSGSLLPDEEVDLSFETSGKITEIFFREGSSVVAGELLAKINDAPLQAELRKLESQLKLFTDRLHRQNVLLEREAVSQEAFQEAQASLAGLQAEIDGVKAKIAQTELRAPFNGIIGLRMVSLGAYASPTTTIAKLTKINPLKLEFYLPERYAGTIEEGTRLSFSVEGDLELREAKIYAFDSHVDPETRNFTVRGIYDNVDGKLFPGRYASVSLTTATYRDAMVIPAEAVVSEMGVDKVFLYRNGTAEPVEIVKGMRNESSVQVLRGLVPGDTVITTGTMQLRTGQKIKLDNVIN